MSGFKTKKLPQAQKPVVKKIDTATGIMKPKKNIIRWIMGIGILLATGAFIVTFSLNVTQDNTKFSVEEFKPLITGEFLSEKKEGTINILIAGIGGEGHEGSDLTDSIMLASLNGDEKRVTLLSIPRDLYIAYPEGKGAGKINSLYAIGKSDKVGIKYLAAKVSEITGQPIDHYVVIDFSGFKKIIDVLGGVAVDVPEDLIDREYPDNNYGYETLIIKKGLQTMDGDLALKYARSRHSTSDFDRSNRQQLIIKAIKEQLFSADTATSPGKISDIFSAVMDHLDTDLSLAQMAETVFGYRSVRTDDIRILSLNNECISLKQCRTGAYLYTPSRDLFGGASVIIPENARINKLSYYDDIRRFVDVTFRFPGLGNSTDEVIIISTRTNTRKAQNIGLSLRKLGIKVSQKYANFTTTGTITQSHVNIYWHPDIEIGINPNTPTVLALKYLEESLPYTIVPHNEYITDDGPKIEIVLGDDMDSFFPFVTPTYYLPAPPPQIVSGESLTWTGVSKPNRTSTSSNPAIRTSENTQKSAPVIENNTTPIQPGEWEDFGDS